MVGGLLGGAPPIRALRAQRHHRRHAGMRQSVLLDEVNAALHSRITTDGLASPSCATPRQTAMPSAAATWPPQHGGSAGLTIAIVRLGIPVSERRWVTTLTSSATTRCGHGWVIFYMQAVHGADGWGPVTCMDYDGHGNVWAGFRSGAVGVWNLAHRRMTTRPLQCCKAPIRCNALRPLLCMLRHSGGDKREQAPHAYTPEIKDTQWNSACRGGGSFCHRVISADGWGHAYVGSAAGDIIAARLRFATSKGSCLLEMAHSLLLQTQGAAAAAARMTWRCLYDGLRAFM